MPISDKHKAIFIHIPKTAGTSMEEILFGKFEGHSSIHTLKQNMSIEVRNFYPANESTNISIYSDMEFDLVGLDEYTIDIASLVDLDSQILVKDISVPKGVEIVTGGDEVVVAISEAKEEEPEEVVEVDMENIEVEQKGKKEEDGEGEPAETEKKEDKK